MTPSAKFRDRRWIWLYWLPHTYRIFIWAKPNKFYNYQNNVYGTSSKWVNLIKVTQEAESTNIDTWKQTWLNTIDSLFMKTIFDTWWHASPSFQPVNFSSHPRLGERECIEVLCTLHQQVRHARIRSQNAHLLTIERCLFITKIDWTTMV
jgi:hypothetical protein